MKRRSFIAAVIASAAAPAFAHSGVLMPIKQLWTPSPLALYPIPGMETAVSGYPRYIRHMDDMARQGVQQATFFDMRGAAHRDNLPLVELGMISVLLPHQKLPPGWEYCDEHGAVTPYDDSADRALFNQIMSSRARTTHTA